MRSPCVDEMWLLIDREKPDVGKVSRRRDVEIKYW
jgi:hypothetical protein